MRSMHFKPVVHYRLLLLFLALLTGSPLYAAAGTDTAYNPLKPTIHNSDISVQADIGIHRTFYVSAGISANSLMGSAHGNVGYNLHLLAEYTPSFKTGRNHICGLNAGGLLMANMVVVGGDVKYLTDLNSQYDVLIVPKAGLGFGGLNLTYGYQISTNNTPFPWIGKHQIALSASVIPLKAKNRLKK